MLAEIFTIIAPVFVLAAIGYIWGRFNWPFDTETITSLVVNVGTPCLIFDTLVRLDVRLAAFGDMALAAALAAAAFAAIGFLTLRLSGQPVANFLPALMFPNAGNMGLPLGMMAFGEIGLALAISFFAVFSLLQFTVGYAIAARRISLAQLAKTPLIYALVLALIIAEIDISPPRWIAASIGLIAGLTIPLMLIALGFSLQRLAARTLGRSLYVALLRLGIGLGVGIGLGWMLGLEGASRGIFVMQCAMPVAVFNYLFAQRYDRTPGDVAAAVVLSTLISFLTLPGLLFIVL